MTNDEFYRTLLPSYSNYCVVGIDKSKTENNTTHRYTNDVKQIDVFVKDLTSRGYDVYFCTAGLGAERSRTARNAVAKQCLYLDLDVGPEDHKYPDKKSAIDSLKAFVIASGFPKPILIDSGVGYHAYWAISEAVPVHQWLNAAHRLKAKCIEGKLKFDAGPTADMVRLLRCPGSINSKNGETVKILNKGTPLSIEDANRIFGGFDEEYKIVQIAKPAPFSNTNSGNEKPAGFKPIVSRSSDLQNARALFGQGEKDHEAAASVKEAVYGSITNSFNLLLDRSVNGTGCQQIKFAYENQDEVTEPQWMNVLRVCKATDEGFDAAVRMSDQYSGYSEEETKRKFDSIKGRTATCQQFHTDSPKHCDGCPNFVGGEFKIRTPLFLSNVLEKAPEDIKIHTTTINDKEVDVEIDLPKLQFPYCFTSKHGLAIETEMGDGSVKPEIIHPFPVYITKLSHERSGQYYAWVRAHIPKDGIKDFCISFGDLSARDAFRNTLNNHGVSTVNAKKIDQLQAFLNNMVQELQFKQTSEVVYNRYGWTESDTFIIGEREYTKDGETKYAPSSPTTMEMAKRVFTLQGSLDGWKDSIRHYERPEFSHFAFGILAGFGAPLMRFARVSGVVVNYHHSHSGGGKSSALDAVSSIYGNPTTFVLHRQDTNLSKINRMGTYSNLPVTMDEITNMTGQEMSDLAYEVSSGRGRNRMSAKANVERANDAYWKTIVLTSANSSFAGKLSSLKMTSQGERARVLDINIESLSKEHLTSSKYILDGLKSNYGWAGDLYMKWLVSNITEAENIWNETRIYVNTMFSFSSVERFKEELIVAVFTARKITQKLGLFAPPMDEMINFLRGEIEYDRDDMLSIMNNGNESALSNFMLKFDPNTIVIHSRRVKSLGAMAAVVGHQFPILREPRGELVARIEYDINTLYVSQPAFNRWCAESQISMRELKKEYARRGVMISATRKRMGKGTDIDVGPAAVYMITHIDKLGMTYEPPADERASKEAA